MNLDVTEWKEFRVGDLFNVELSRGDIKADESDEGDVILVSSGETNNGVVKHIDSAGDGKAEIFDGNKITIDMFGNVFYQHEPFYAVSHGRVNILSAKFEMNKSIGLFIAAVIKKEQFKYSYGRAIYSNEAVEMIIKLPADADGNPDWKFMEDYIKSLHHKPLTTKNKPGQAPELNVSEWKEFPLSIVFSRMESGNISNAGDLEEGFDLPYLGAKKDDNGVMQMCIDIPAKRSLGNCVVMICDGEGSVGLANYMDSDFLGTVNLVLGYNEKHINPYTGLFLATVLSQERPKYSFGRKWKTHIPETIIKLPSDVDGNPDWQFMENYIKALPYGDRLEG